MTSDADCSSPQQGRRSFVDDTRLRCPQQDHSSAHELQVGYWGSQRGQIQTNGHRRAPDSIKNVVSQTNADRRCSLLQLFISTELAARAPLQPLDLFHYSSLLSFALGFLAALASFIRVRRWSRRMSAPVRHRPLMADKKKQKHFPPSANHSLSISIYSLGVHMKKSRKKRNRCVWQGHRPTKSIECWPLKMSLRTIHASPAGGAASHDRMASSSRCSRSVVGLATKKAVTILSNCPKQQQPRGWFNSRKKAKGWPHLSAFPE